MTTTRNGLQRFAFDLHVHTPASNDWRDGEITAVDLVDQALSIGLDGIALTDHATGGWVDDVKTAASGTDLVIFPAVELNDLATKASISWCSSMSTSHRPTSTAS